MINNDLLSNIVRYATTAVSFDILTSFTPSAAYSKSVWRTKTMIESRGLVPNDIDTPAGMTWYEYYLKRNRTFYGAVLAFSNNTYFNLPQLLDDSIVIFHRMLGSLPAIDRRSVVWRGVYIKQLPDLDIIVDRDGSETRIDGIRSKLRYAKWNVFESGTGLLMLVDEYNRVWTIVLRYIDTPRDSTLTATRFRFEGDVTNIIFEEDSYGTLVLLDRRGIIHRAGTLHLSLNGDIPHTLRIYNQNTRVIDLVSNVYYAVMADNRLGRVSSEDDLMEYIAPMRMNECLHNGIPYRFIKSTSDVVMTPNRMVYFYHLNDDDSSQLHITDLVPVAHCVQYIQQEDIDIYALVDANALLMRLPMHPPINLITLILLCVLIVGMILVIYLLP